MSDAEWNREFVQRLLERRANERADYERRLHGATEEVAGLEGGARSWDAEAVLETIVREERPVLFVKDDAIHPLDPGVPMGREARELVAGLERAAPVLNPCFPLVGRIDVTNFPGMDYAGTGWFVDRDIVVTNRHVASLIARWDGRKFAFSRGIGGQTIGSSVCTTREIDRFAATPDRTFNVLEVLHIAPDAGPDIAFVRVERQAQANVPFKIEVADADVGHEEPVCVIGYPARAPRSVIPDQEWMKELYGDVYDVKRIAPGLSMRGSTTLGTHDCTTLGGNSGSVVLDVRTGLAVGLHFAGAYRHANYAVSTAVLRQYVNQRRWEIPSVDTPASEPPRDARPQAPAPAPADAPGGGSATVTLHVPLTITVSAGAPVVVAASAAASQAAAPPSPADVETAAQALYDQRLPGILATRIGYDLEGDSFGGAPFVAASVAPDRLASVVATAPTELDGIPIQYFPADVGEQLEALAQEEASGAVAYDDDARRGDDFSFKTVKEKMDLTLHVGPEYSWSVLERFIKDAKKSLVSGIYEFHARHVADALERRLEDGVSLKLVLDNVSFSKIRHEDEEFDRVEVFREWEESHQFERIVAPEGRRGLIYNSYHIKVTVRDDDTVWLSSGNWKMRSSQPLITEDQLDNAASVDLPGNREWHVVLKSKTLAARFRNHLVQDFERSEQLGGRHVPRRLLEETFVLVPAVDESVPLEERRPPSRVLAPKTIRRTVKVKPLLTPDRDGSVYCDAVLELIESAQTSLLFQIPYIGMPPSPRANRGYIDELIRALTRKLKTLDDARVILRSGGSRLSSPRHAAWYFKAKGVDIDSRLRVVQNHHTKGMIVDGKRVLVGSHNWSGAGVTINRDASLLFYDRDVAEYYAEAFEIDWARANKLRPARYRAEAPVFDAATASAIAYRRIALSEWMSDD